jgi:YgiT-type zinc finger domain-containing protein
MRNRCNFCGNKNFQEKKVEYIYKHDNNFLLIKDVPAEVCEYCGEKYFKSDVLKKIENDYKNIYEKGKKPSNQIVLPVEEFVDL